MSDKSPDAFRTISEVADWLGVQPHVLRFWESKFSQVRPVKRAGGRRYYRPNDMLLLGGIRKLLHEDGLTIKGAQKVLREEGMSHVASLSQPLDAESAALSDLAAAAEEHAGVSQPEETGQVLDFEAARPEAEPSQPPPDTPEPVAERQMDEEAADKTHEASADTSDMADARELDQPKTDEALEERISAEMGSTPDSPDDSNTREHTQEDAPAKAPLPSFMRDPSNRKSAAPEASDPDAPEPDQTDAAPEVAAAPISASDRLPSFLQSRPASAEPPAPDIEDKETAPEAPGAEAEQAGPEEDHGAGTAAAGAAPEPDAPGPRIVDVPDPDESAFEVTSSALSAAFAAAPLSQDRRAELLPLVAQLAALRDRMAAAQGR